MSDVPLREGPNAFRFSRYVTFREYVRFRQYVRVEIYRAGGDEKEMLAYIAPCLCSKRTNRSPWCFCLCVFEICFGDEK